MNEPTKKPRRAATRLPGAGDRVTDPVKSRPYDSLNVRPELGTIAKADQLAALYSTLDGRKVARPDAIDRALAEAIERLRA